MSKINDTREIPEGNSPNNLKLIKKYQMTEPSVMDKYKYVTYRTGYFCEENNIDLNLMTCEDIIFIQGIL